MAALFHLPQMGQTMTEGTILRWLKQEGDRVEEWEPIVEMMTDKVNMEVEPRIGGTLRKILAPEGSVVPVGAPIAIIGEPDEDIEPLLAEAAVAPQPAAAEPVPDASAPGIPPASAARPVAEFPAVSPRAREAAEAAGIPWKSLDLPGTGFEGMVVERDVVAYLEARERVPERRATPLAAKMAAELGVPLESIPGTGPRGRVTSEDIRRAARVAGPAARPPAIEAREIPLTGMRQLIARRLAASYREAVHVPLRLDVDMAAAAELRRQLKPALEAQGARLTYTDLVAAAVTRALIDFPILNATLENEVLRVHPTVNLGVAVALEEGLTVPVLRDAQTFSLPELSRALQELVRRARAGELPPDAYAGGTFTVTNLGAFGIESFDPILNPPQVAILGVGAILDRVVPIGGTPTVRPMMTLTLTFDHRATDGAPAAQFLARVRELLENPARLLLPA